MINVIEELAQSPQLPLYVAQLNALLAQEQRKRQTFYESITEDDKAEFINGEIMFQSPAKLRHVEVSSTLLTLLKTFITAHPVGMVGSEKMLVSLTRNDYEPDICFFRQEKAATFSAEQMQFPAPDLIVEILSPSTEKNDRGIKFKDYAAHGVTEYWIVDAEAQTVEQYVLQDDAYELRIKAHADNIASVAIEGLDLPIRAIFDPQVTRLTLQRFLA